MKLSDYLPKLDEAVAKCDAWDERDRDEDGRFAGAEAAAEYRKGQRNGPPRNNLGKGEQLRQKDRAQQIYEARTHQLRSK